MTDALRDDARIRELRRTVQELRDRGWKFEYEDRIDGLRATKVILSAEDLEELVEAEVSNPHTLTRVPDNVYELIDGLLDRMLWDADNLADDDTKDEYDKTARAARRMAKQFAGERFAKLCECAAFDAVHGTESVMLNLLESDFYYSEMLPVVTAMWKHFLARELRMGEEEKKKSDEEVCE